MEIKLNKLEILIIQSGLIDLYENTENKLESSAIMKLFKYIEFEKEHERKAKILISEFKGKVNKLLRGDEI